MTAYLTVAEYLETAETNRRQELVYGVLREPPAPAYGHQDAVTRLGPCQARWNVELLLQWAG